MCGKMFLPDRESNPGLPRDRRRSSPLDYRGQTYGQLLLNNFSRFESWRDPEKNSNFLSLSIENVGADQKMWNASRFCVSSLRRGHANLLCKIKDRSEDDVTPTPCLDNNQKVHQEEIDDIFKQIS